MNESLTNHLVFGIIGMYELLLLVGMLIVFLLVFGALITFVVWLARQKPTPPPVSPAPAVPVRHNCPQCGTALSPGAAQGLCPRCLMSVGLGTQTVGMTTEPGANNEQPPEVAELAKIFPHLELTELLGRGGMGAVYKARQPQLDRIVALKILSPRLSRDPAFAERFAREARALAKLSHPNIVGIHDFGQAGGFYYFVMEYVDGMNLGQLERTKRFTPQEALAIVPRICEALQYAHDEGVVHRDIKPANILIDTKGRVKIADFGIAKLIGQPGDEYALTHGRVVLGTPHYMAPEQVEKPQDVDHRADIYSLGVVFYEMLTGELPLGRFANPSKKVEMDVRLDEVVLRALEKEPALRYQQASEVKTMVENFATQAIVESAKPAATTPPKRRKWLPGWMVKTAIILLLCVLGAWLGDRGIKDYFGVKRPWKLINREKLDIPMPAIARLPEGAVELLAVRKPSGPSGDVWRPGGGSWRLNFTIAEGSSVPLPPESSYWFLFRFKEGKKILQGNTSGLEPEFEITTDLSKASANAPKISQVRLAPNQYAWMLSTPLPTDAKTVDMRIGYPLSQWQFIGDTNFQHGPRISQTNLVFSDVQEQGWGMELKVSTTKDLTDHKIRVVAVTKNGQPFNRQVAEVLNTKTENGVTTFAPQFPGLKLKDGLEFWVEVLPLAWVKFENVALSPDDSTKVVITDAPSGSAPDHLADLRAKFANTNTLLSDADLVAWQMRLAALNDKGWREAFAAGQQLTALPPEHGLKILKTVWPLLVKEDARQQILKAFNFADHPKQVDVLELGLLDNSPEVQSWAVNYIQGLSFRDFSTNIFAAKQWVNQNRDRSLSQILSSSADWLAVEVEKADEAALRQIFERLKFTIDLSEARKAAPLTPLWDALGRKFNGANEAMNRLVLQCATKLEVDDTWAARYALPLLQNDQPQRVRIAAAQVLGRHSRPWAVDPLCEVLLEEVSLGRQDTGLIWAAASALSAINDKRAILRMIQVIEMDDTYGTIYGVGYYGLSRLTGVTYDQSHDGKWWRNWWEQNKSKYVSHLDS